jgi:MATE family multidrug resistance protein
LQYARLRSEISDSVHLAGPLIMAQLAQMSMGFIDTVMVGRLGPDSLAAVALGSAGYFPFLVMSIGVLTAVSPMVAQARGAGRISPVGRTVRQGLWLAVLLAIPCIVIQWNLGPLFQLVVDDPTSVDLTVSYLRPLLGGFLPALFFAVLRNYIEALARPRPVMLITFVGVGLNIFLNYTLMFGRLGFPELGVAGCGWATAIVYWSMFGMIVLFVRGTRDLRKYGVFTQLGRPDAPYFRRLFKIGWPVGVMLGIETGLFATAAFLMGSFGTVELAAHQIALQCAAFTFMIPLGIALATSIRVGHAVGRHDLDGARIAGHVGMGLGATVMVITAMCFWLFPRPIVSLYLDLSDAANAAVVAQAISLLGIAAVFQVFDGLQVTAGGALRGLADTRVPMVIGFASYWVIGLTTSVLLAYWAGLRAQGVWWGLVLGLAVASVLLLYRFERMTGSGRVGLAPISVFDAPAARSGPEPENDRDVVEGMGPGGHSESPEQE